MKNFQVTNNFKVFEFFKSDTATSKGINNTTEDIETILNIQALATAILQPLREQLGVPIRITSGFRSYKLNKAIGGSQTSQHSRGEAVDFKLPKASDYRRAFDIIRQLGCFDQLLWEYGNSNAPDWIHVSYKRVGTNRGQILRAVKKNGKTVYEQY